MRARRPTPWWSALAVLACVRVAIPLAAAAGSPPGVPHFVRSPVDGGLNGDATGFYAATREFMAAWGRMPRPVLGATALLACAGAAALVATWRRRPASRAWLVPAAVLLVALVVCVDIHWMEPSGAAVFGWPLVWGSVMLPYRVVFGLTKHAAWDIGVALSLLFAALTVVAVGHLGRNATGRRWAGILAAACWTLWPLLVGAIAGHHAWSNNQWNVDTGLANYDEPLSTLLVTTGAALLLSPVLTPMRLALSGCALGVATCVKLSNALLALAALAIVAVRGGARDTLPYLAGALSFAPVVLVYWPISYPKLFHNRHSWPVDPFDLRYAGSSWTHSSIFDLRTLAIVLPLAVVGAFAVRRPWPLALVLAFLLVNPLFYSFFANTALHPRFLYASLPELFVLWAAAAALVVGHARSLRT